MRTSTLSKYPTPPAPIQYSIRYPSGILFTSHWYPIDFLFGSIDITPGLLTNMLGNAPKPRVIFTDRGPGLYQGSHGAIVNLYNKALEKNGFRPFAGTNASWQPPDIADLLLHETVAAWVRKYFRGHPIKWCNDQDKNYAEFVRRLKECEKFINKNHNLKSLSLSFPRRVKQLRKEKGRRLRF